MPQLKSTRTSQAAAMLGMRHSTSHKAAPPNNRTGSGRRWSNTRAPVQVSANAVNNSALARSIEIRSETDPYMPNSITEAARIRSAKPHHATARIAVFCTHANNNSNPRIAST